MLREAMGGRFLVIEEAPSPSAAITVVFGASFQPSAAGKPQPSPLECACRRARGPPKAR